MTISISIAIAILDCNFDFDCDFEDGIKRWFFELVAPRRSVQAWHNGKYWMTYIGWDGTGYQTGLASSDNLLNWNKERLLLGRGPKGSATEYNVALTCLLRDHELFGPGTLKRVNGRFVGTYHAYPHPGYEVGPAAIGLCYSDDLQAWDICPPVLFPEPSCAWERFSGNPVLRLGAKGDFDDIFASDPCVCARKRQTAGRNQPR